MECHNRGLERQIFCGVLHTIYASITAQICDVKTVVKYAFLVASESEIIVVKDNKFPNKYC